MNATTAEFFLTYREMSWGESVVWCSEHDAPVDTWTPGPAFKDRTEAEKFIADSRDWYEGDNPPNRCLFLHPES